MGWYFFKRCRTKFDKNNIQYISTYIFLSNPGPWIFVRKQRLCDSIYVLCISCILYNYLRFNQPPPNPNQKITLLGKFLYLIIVLIQHIWAETNVHDFADDIFKCIFWYENVYILIQVLVEIMSLCRMGDKTLSQPTVVYFTDAHTHTSISMNQIHKETFFMVFFFNICYAI